MEAFKISSQFCNVLEVSIQIDRKTACKVVKIIEVEHGEDGLEKMSEACFLEKAKFIMKHNINKE